MSPRPDAAVLLIGSELLSGRVRDENLHYLADELWRLGVPLKTARMVRDSVGEVAEATRSLSHRHAVVFTTGGIGPTHDDVTMEGVARAYGVAVIQHPVLARMIRERLGDSVTEPHLRMARVPDGADLVGAEQGEWPTVRKENTYILPGVPSILRKKFPRLRSLFRQAPFHRLMIGFVTNETSIAETLDRIAVCFPDVEIGSYPETDSVLVTLESESHESVRRARAELERETSGIPRTGGP